MKVKKEPITLSVKKELRLVGSAICAGVAIGKPFFFSENEEAPPEFSISNLQIEEEINRYREALSRSKEEVVVLKRKLEEDKAWESAAILDTHLQIMQDPSMTSVVEQKIRTLQKNTESIFHATIREYQVLFSRIPDEFFKERFQDIQDIACRIMRHLGNRRPKSFSEIPHHSIIFAKELVPSDTAEITHQTVGGFVTEVGGETSHAAIMAKAHGIPYVANILFPGDYNSQESVIIDGIRGEVILYPSEQTLDYYKELKSLMTLHFHNLEKQAHVPSETIDGYKIDLFINAELSTDFRLLSQMDAKGVGLFRSESLCLKADAFPEEEEQFLVYKNRVEQLQGLPLVIRTFDVGGDKVGRFYPWQAEKNPFLGCRAIRFMMKEQELFKEQLRAILRASHYGQIHILLPMISGIVELREVKKLLREVKMDLQQEGCPFSEEVKLGCMIEVPSAALICETLAKECDFLSIGTNDLVQYCLAVDRCNAQVSSLYTPFHPSVIRLIRFIASAGKRVGIPVAVCGEIAGDPRFTALLIGLGIQELSMAPRQLPIIRHAIRNLSILEAIELAEQALLLETPSEIQELVNQEHSELQ